MFGTTKEAEFKNRALDLKEMLPEKPERIVAAGFHGTGYHKINEVPNPVQQAIETANAAEMDLYYRRCREVAAWFIGQYEKVYGGGANEQT